MTRECELCAPYLALHPKMRAQEFGKQEMVKKNSRGSWKHPDPYRPSPSRSFESQQEVLPGMKTKRMQDAQRGFGDVISATGGFILITQIIPLMVFIGKLSDAFLAMNNHVAWNQPASEFYGWIGAMTMFALARGLFCLVALMIVIAGQMIRRNTETK